MKCFRNFYIRVRSFEFIQCFDLDLPNALSCQPYFDADLLKRERFFVVEPVPQPEDGGFALIDDVQQVMDRMDLIDLQQLESMLLMVAVKAIVLGETPQAGAPEAA